MCYSPWSLKESDTTELVNWLIGVMQHYLTKPHECEPHELLHESRTGVPGQELVSGEPTWSPLLGWEGESWATFPCTDLIEKNLCPEHVIVIKINFASIKVRLRTCLGLRSWATPYMPCHSHLEDDRGVHGAVTTIHLPSHVKEGFSGWCSRCFEMIIYYPEMKY